jgi:hypothetical protein
MLMAGVAIFTTDTVVLKPKLVRRDKEGHFILIYGAIYKEEITIVNLYVVNVGAPNFIKHNLLDLKIQIDHNIVVMGDFSIPLSPIDRSSRQKNHQRSSRI